MTPLYDAIDSNETLYYLTFQVLRSNKSSCIRPIFQFIFEILAAEILLEEILCERNLYLRTNKISKKRKAHC